MTAQTRERKEKVTYIGGFIPEIAKRLLEDLNFSQAYIFSKRNLVLAWVNSIAELGRPRLYSDSRTLDCVRTILAGNQWYDSKAEGNVGPYTGRWERVENIFLSSKYIDDLIEAMRANEKAERRLNRRLIKITGVTR